MEECNAFIHDDCVEILVNTDIINDLTARGSANEQSTMSSFETLVNTALALEDDPRNEHSYAYTLKKSAQEGKDKDHSYASDSKLLHRKVQSLSEEDLCQSSHSDNRSIMLPHYLSNDSALDVTGFDTISDKCLSCENIHLKTVDVFTHECILPGISDPDISKMTLQSCSDTNESQISKKSSVVKKLSVDHTYSHDEKPTDKVPLLDHSYDQSKKRLPSSSGVKRGRSSDDIDIIGMSGFKKKDFKNSPFLDHLYQSVEIQKKTIMNNKDVIDLEPEKNSIRKLSAKKPSQRKRDHSNRDVDTENALDVHNTDDHNQRRVRLDNKYQLESCLDHTYEQIADTSTEICVNKFFVQVGDQSHDQELKTEQTDHSYVITEKYNNQSSAEECSHLELSDSGTESLNEDEDNCIASTFIRLVTMHKDHAYVK